MTSSNRALIQSDPVIVSLVRASAALVEAKTIQQTKKILDVAAAAEIYARRQHLGEEAEAIAVSIKVEALRKLGEMLKAAPKAKGELRRGTKSEPRETDASTLAELGLSKKESAVAQKLATLSEEAFEQVRDGHVTVAKAIAAVVESKGATATKPPKQDQAPPVEDDGPSAAEVAEAEVAARDDAERVRLILESDNALAAMTEKCKQQAAQIRILEDRVRGLTNEAAHAIRLAKSWRTKFERLEKAAA